MHTKWLQKKRIFITGYSDHKGGVEKYIDNLTGALPQYDFVYSMPIMTVDGKVWHRPPNRHNYIKYRWFWYRFFKENRFDVLYYNTCDVVSIDMLRFAKHAGIPVRIIHSHNSGIQQAVDHKMCLFHRCMDWHNRKVLDQYATHFFACSKAAGDWMFGRHPYTIIKNGILLSDYAFSKEYRLKIRRSIGLKDELLVGIVGRLSAQKNPLFAAEIIRTLLKLKPDAHAAFLGDGELRHKTEDMVQNAGIQYHVHFMGNVDNVNEWMSAFDVLLMPSLFEGLPFVLVEAQAAGLPCLVSSSVSSEADLTGLIQFVDLSSRPEKWAEEIMNHLQERKQLIKIDLSQYGYDVHSAANTVQKVIDNALLFHK